MTKKDIIKLVTKDLWMMSILKKAESLNLPDWMIGAGFLRNKVWNHLHNINKKTVDTRDIDLIYFDTNNISEKNDKILSQKMKGSSDLEWEIVNQAYTHLWKNRKKPYKNTEEAISEWVETATCVAITLKKGKLEIIAPHGIDDLVNLILRPSPFFINKLDVFNKRIEDKKWLEKWPKLKTVIKNSVASKKQRCV
ncbi:MAG: nucleotidyltransferase family protein [Patescibacteria group bacterium]|nr:nucleotidyltransferase family protein [Patescibacteria group bacterium]